MSYRTAEEGSSPGLLALVFLLSATTFAGRTAPAYPELYRDPPRTDQLIPADLPNLARQVVLEATSMFVHARSELSDSPEAFRLLDQIRALWNEADAFTAAVSTGDSASRALEAGWLVYPDLDAAYQRVRSTLEVLPGNAPRAAENLQSMSRAMAVIGPLLRQGLQQTAAPAGPAAGQRERSLAVVAIRGPGPSPTRCRPCAPRLRPRPAVSRARRLRSPTSSTCFANSVWAWSASPCRGARNATSFRRSAPSAQAGRIDLEARTGGLPGRLWSSWCPIKARIDEIADRYQLPREVVLRLPEMLLLGTSGPSRRSRRPSRRSMISFARTPRRAEVR